MKAQKSHIGWYTHDTIKAMRRVIKTKLGLVKVVMHKIGKIKMAKKKQISMMDRMAKQAAKLWDDAQADVHEGYSYLDIGIIQKVKFEDGIIKVTIQKHDNGNFFVLGLKPIKWNKHKGTSN